MRWKNFAVCTAWALSAAAATATPVTEELLDAMRSADVVILGETHDNPEHHRVQAEIVRALEPSAMVWEMLTEEGGKRVTRKLVDDPERLAQVLNWADSGWPPMTYYVPIFQAAPDAPIYGAQVPRAAAIAVVAGGAAVAFGPESERYGLTEPLPAEEQAAREAYQNEAHCDALPVDKLPAMVEIQRLRDARLAQAAEKAVIETGGPVVIITGNEHARLDRGIPVYLAHVAPDRTVFSLGQSEVGQIAGEFDAVVDSPLVEREDPCKAFRLND